MPAPESTTAAAAPNGPEHLLIKTAVSGDPKTDLGRQLRPLDKALRALLGMDLREADCNRLLTEVHDLDVEFDATTREIAGHYIPAAAQDLSLQKISADRTRCRSLKLHFSQCGVRLCREVLAILQDCRSEVSAHISACSEAVEAERKAAEERIRKSGVTQRAALHHGVASNDRVLAARAKARAAEQHKNQFHNSRGELERLIVEFEKQLSETYAALLMG